MPGSIALMEKVLTNMVGVENALTPPQLSNLFEMYLSLLHFRKVTPEYWMKNCDLAVKGMILTAQVQSEGAMFTVEGLPEAAKKVMNDAILISIKEIAAVRRQIGKELQVLTQCAPDGTPIH